MCQPSRRLASPDDDESVNAYNKEQRLKCVDKLCVSGNHRCKVSWVVWTCSRTHQVHVRHNDTQHQSCIPNPNRARGCCASRFDGRKEGTDRIPHRAPAAVALNEARFDSAPRGRPTHRQVADFVRNYRRSHGRGIQTQPTKAITAANVFSLDIDETTPGFFSVIQDVGFDRDQVDEIFYDVTYKTDLLLIGITYKKLLRRAVEFNRGQVDGISYDATYKINKLRYPLITCGFTDAARQYHLVAIFVASHVRERNFEQMFSALQTTAQRIGNQRLRAPATMTDADDAQAIALESLGAWLQDLSL
ncbi:TPA: hypothetical protein N0F65_002245, partial [Lagenidium giganteum]